MAKCKNTWHRGDQYKCQDIRYVDKEWHCDDKCPFINDGPPQYEPCPVPVINKVDTDQKAKIEEIIKGLKLRENPLLSKHPDIQEEAIKLVSEYHDLFSEAGDPGVTDLIEFNITLKDGAQPIKARTRPLNPTQMASLRKQLDLW